MNKRPKSNSIRIIAGTWRGRRLPVLDSVGLRPSTDRVRETLFNWLMHEVPGSRCLDLFAGTGVLGLECLSRGAEFVHFVELDPLVAGALEANLEKLQVGDDKAKCTKASALRVLSDMPCDLYDLVFLDPPFNSMLLAQSIDLLRESNCLSQHALVYIEHSASLEQLEIPENWKLYRSASAGQSHYGLYQF